MEDIDPRVSAAGAVLFQRLQSFLTGRPWSLSTVNNAVELVHRHRVHCKSQGIDFPKLVPLVLVRSKWIEFVRPDMELPGIQQTIINLTVKCPEVTPHELALAINKAFPQYRRMVDTENKLVRQRIAQVSQSNVNGATPS